MTFSSARFQAENRAKTARRGADNISSGIRPVPMVTVKRFGKNKVTDINMMPSLITQMDDIFDAAAVRASASMMDEAIEVWESDNSGSWSLASSTIRKKRAAGSSQPEKPLFEDGDLISSLTPTSSRDGKRVFGGIGFEDEDMQKLIEILEGEGIHGPGFKWMATVAERGQEKFIAEAVTSIALDMRKFSMLGI